MLSKIKKLQENVKKQPKNNIDDETPKITSQDLKRVNMPTKPIEEENLKTPEELGEKIPTENQPIEEVVEASVGGKTRFKTPPFLLTL